MFRVNLRISEDVRRVREAQGRLAGDKRALLERVGIQALSLCQLAYRDKARGGTGSDGITWKPLQRSTIEARVRSRGPAKRIVEQRRRAADQIRSAKGKGSGAKRAKLRQKRKDLLTRLNSLVDAEFSRHEIGVDTGLQRSSAQPGFAASDGHGGNVMVVEAGRVTVGYGREYSKYFDEIRELIPDKLPPEWIVKLEATIEQWARDIARQSGIEGG